MCSWNRFVFEFNFQHFKGATGSSFIFFSVSFCWAFFEDLTRKIEVRNQLERQVMATEFNFIESQINPHFLFNVLGCISGLALIGSDDTNRAVKNLKQLISGASSMKTGQRIPLEDELEFIRSFIHLHQIRYAVPIEVDFPTEDFSHLKIEPMLLLPIVENVFKHGDVTERGAIKILCVVYESTFYFLLENKIDATTVGKPMGGIGDENVRKRLKLAYGDQATYQSVRDENSYKTELKIDLR